MPNAAQIEVLIVENQDQLYTQADAAKYLSVTEHFLAADRVRKREIPYVKIGRCVRYQKSAIDAYLARQTMGGIAA